MGWPFGLSRAAASLIPAAVLCLREMNNFGLDMGGAARKRDERMVSYVSRKLIGNRVRLQGLQKRADLNGTEGEVEDYHEASKRFMIACDGPCGDWYHPECIGLDDHQHVCTSTTITAVATRPSSTNGAGLGLGSRRLCIAREEPAS